MPFSPIPQVLDDLRAGRMVILTDDEDRENEGDLILPAQFVTPEAVNFMLSVARGYLCLSLTAADCDRLDLHPQAGLNTTTRGTAFTVSIDGHPRHGFTTGVSAHERARCIRMAIDRAFGPHDFVRPGHINPLRSRDGGTLVRTGQTEGSLDLCRMAGLYPAAAIIEVMRDDGEMARLPDLERLAATHNLKICSVAQIIQWRMARESLVRRIEPPGGTLIQTEHGEFNLIAYQSIVDPLPHVALTVGDVGRLDSSGAPIPVPDPTLVRVHRQHLLGDVFGDTRSSPEGPTARTLHASMRIIQREGRGVVLYLRPIGLDVEGQPETGNVESLLQRFSHGGGHALLPGRSTDQEDGRGWIDDKAIRDIGIGSQILRDLGISQMRLLTNHQSEWPGLDAFGLRVVERVSTSC